MSAIPRYPTSTEPGRLDAALTRLREGAEAWAALPVLERLRVARSMREGFARVAARTVAAACEARGVPPGSPLEGEEWLAAPFVTLRLLRQLARSLAQVARHGSTRVGRLGASPDGRLTARVFPSGPLDAVLFPGARAEVRFLAGVDAQRLHATRARHYREPRGPGRVCLVLGAGNNNSIPPLDVASKLFAEGQVCLLKMNPVNAYLGPLLEEAFAEAVSRGFLAVAYGGAEEGAYLARHPGVDSIHLTGSVEAHDRIVWGPPGPERAERMARGRPLVEKEVTSELGNITPVVVVPGPYRDRELAWQAENVAGMVTHNVSFNCIAGKMLVVPRGWPRRVELLERIERAFALAPARRAYYPGAADRYRSLTEGREVRAVGPPPGAGGGLPWTLVPDLDPENPAEPAFRTEPFCPILSETALGGEDPVEFLARAVDFCNRRLWGTLNAVLVVHPATLADARAGAAVEKAIAELRYGTVALNVWTGVAYAMGTVPWGGYPGTPLNDVQSGRGWVHNTLMLEQVEKTVVRAPLVGPVKLPYFPGHRTVRALGRRMTALEASGNPLRLPGVLAAAVRG